MKRKDFKDSAGRRRWLKKIEKLKEQGKWNLMTKKIKARTAVNDGWKQPRKENQ